MDRKEMDAKLLKHGLPMWGTDEECLVRLERNGIVSAKVVSISPASNSSEFPKKGDLVKDITTNEVHEVIAVERRKGGRPKKAK